MEDMKKPLELDDGWKKLMESIHAAMNEATKEGIKANTIIINENMVKIRLFIIPHGMYAPASKFMPPMICGLNVYFTANELPDGYSFAVCEGAPRRQNLDMSGAIEDIFEKTLYDREVITKILNMARDYWEV